MNAAHAHLALNHLPIFGVLFAFGVMLWATLRQNRDIVKVALAMMVVSAAAALPVYFSGEGAEEVIQNFPGVTESVIKPHEEAAVWALSSVLVLGALAVWALVLLRRPAAPPAWLLLGILFWAGLTSAIFLRTAVLGGRIHHTEIRPAGTLPDIPAAAMEH